MRPSTLARARCGVSPRPACSVWEDRSD